MPRPRLIASALTSILVLSAAGCSSTLLPPRPGDPVARRGDEIVAAGQLFHTGTPVVLWLDPKGYDAYAAHRHFDPSATMPSHPVSDDAQRYGRRRTMPNNLRAAVSTEGWTLENLREQVDQFVIHYDVCGTSRQCFKVLQDIRGLSVQFMLDVDGTLYQSLDLKERAWHAGDANCRSVGVEIAHMGAYGSPEGINKYYEFDANGWPYFVLPAHLLESGIRTAGFIARPARRELISGEINGRTYYQYDFTNEQYAALIKLTAALHRVLPKMKLDVPRNPDGSVRTDVLSKEELQAWSGLIGHNHVIKVKQDPGPAFNWDRVLQGARRELGLIF